MAAASSMAEIADLRHSGLEFLLDPVDRFRLIEVAGGAERTDPLVMMSVAAGQHNVSVEQEDSGRKRKQSPNESLESAGELNPDAPLWCTREVTVDVERPDPQFSMVAGTSALVRADSSCAILVGGVGGAAEQSGSAGKKQQLPTRSVESMGKVNPEVPGWTRRLRIGRAPVDRAPCPGRVTPLEETIRRYADKPQNNVVKPEIGMSFDSLGEAYDFYNLYSWELGFGIRYGKSRLNVERTKCMQEIVCECSGKPEQQNSWSCRCECPAMIRLLRAAHNGWYIAEYRSSHNHLLSLTCGEKIHWPSHKHIDVYTKDLVKQLRSNNVNLNKVYSIVGSFFGSTENVPFTKQTLRNLCGRISQDQADDDVNKTLAVFKEIQRNDPEFTYRVQGDEERRIKNLMWTNGNSKLQYMFFGCVITFFFFESKA